MSSKYIIKVLTLGDTMVGKSSIVVRFADNKFDDNIFSTIGIDFKTKYIKIGDNDMLSYDFNLEVQKGDNWKVKTNILYGENDSMVDKESLMKFVNSHDATLTIMDGGEHYFHTFGQLKFLRNWLKELL